MARNVLDYLEAAASQYPEKIAFSDTKNQVSYRHLLTQAKAIGCSLSARVNSETNQPVVVFVDRSTASLVMFLGTVFSGNFYIPIDIKMPRQRIEVMLDTLKPTLLVVQKKDASIAESLGVSNQTVLYEEAVSFQIEESILAGIRTRAIDSDPLCVYYTSGSTGIPKGAILSHRSVIEMTEHFSKIFSFSDECIFGNQAAFDFSVSLKDIYSTLKNAAALHILPADLFAFPPKLIQCLNEKKINTAVWTTSALRIIANLKGLEQKLPAHLNKMLFSGEMMPMKVINYWRKFLPHVQYVNLYGQSEIAYNCSYYIVDRQFEDNELLPAGKTFPNNHVFVLDEKGQRAGINQTGEIYIRGICLASGYYNNPVETSKAFCQNPQNPHFPEPVYRTGDLGKYNERGELVVLSRKDQQIKHMGHRIELGEIEVAANSLSFLEAACCLYDTGQEKIVLFYQAPQKCDREILVALQEYIPKYMLPNKLIHYQRLPLNKNEKIDRTNLKEQYFGGIGH